MTKKIDSAEVIYREDLYPRLKTSPVTVQKYAADLDVLPPIEINQHNELIDGWHRWTAHKKKEVQSIEVIITQTKSDAHLLELAIEKNAVHGLQLSQEDKKDMARKIYHATAERDRPEKKKQLAVILSVSVSSVSSWLSRIDKDAKAARKKRIFNRWLECSTQQEIADAESVSRAPIVELLYDFPILENHTKSTQSNATHATDFTPPIYNIWKQQSKTNKVGHFGNTEANFLDNLLYLYTKPFDVVIDPFAGGGSTIDVCQKRLRRYWASDRAPIIEREKDIRKHDITDGLPKVPRWKDVKLVYLDPPYWKQAAGEYSDSPKDLANMDLSTFTDQLSKLIKSFAAKLTDAYIALIIQPTQWKAPKKQYTDHLADLIKSIKYSIDMRISCPYESQQANAQMVTWAQENKTLLVLSREIIVWKI